MKCASTGAYGPLPAPRCRRDGGPLRRRAGQGRYPRGYRTEAPRTATKSSLLVPRPSLASPIMPGEAATLLGEAATVTR